MIRKTRKFKSNNESYHSRKLKKAILCGSFNPFHEGHLFLIKKALKKFDFVYILIAQNPHKPLSDKQKIYQEIKQILLNHNLINQTQILINEGLVPEYIKNLDTNHIIRGFRNFKDFLYEQNLKNQYLKINRKIKFHLYRTNFKNRKQRSSLITNNS